MSAHYISHVHVHNNKEGMPHERKAPKRGHRNKRYSRDWTNPVTTILEKYIDACEFPPIGCSRIYNQDGKKRPNSYTMAEYKADVELGFAYALRNHPHLIPVLQNIIKELADQAFEPVSAGERVAVIQLLGPHLVYTRKLSPWSYFARHKRAWAKQHDEFENFKKFIGDQ